MRVLIAPDKFKGTLTAVEAASAIAAGWLSVRPDDAVEQVLLADGGEGRSTRSSPRAAGVAGGSASEVRSARRSRLRTGSSARAAWRRPSRRAALHRGCGCSPAADAIRFVPRAGARAS